MLLLYSNVIDERFFNVSIDLLNFLKSIDGPDLVLSSVNLNDGQLLLTILLQSLA